MSPKNILNPLINPLLFRMAFIKFATIRRWGKSGVCSCYPAGSSRNHLRRTSLFQNLCCSLTVS